MREHSPSEVRDAMFRQWDAIAIAIPALDLDLPSRIDGWRNREVVAHLSAQPRLLVKFLASASHEPPEITLQRNLAGTRGFATTIDEAARNAPSDLSFADGVARARHAIAPADLSSTITTMQGRIRVVDYLVTRCVEGVVHGGDLVPPVTPDAEALTIVADVFVAIAGERAAELSPKMLVDAATGRVAPPAGLADVLPVMG